MTDKIIFTDMDGVIARYKRADYAGDYSENAAHEDKPRFLREPDFFVTCEPDAKIIEAFRIIADNGMKIMVLSNIMETPLAEGHINGKRIWLEKHMPFIAAFHPINIPKVAYAENELLKRSLTMSDVLISDFNNDVVPWDMHGGTGVKYINGLNSPESYKGYKLMPEWTSNQIANFLIGITAF